ATNVTQKIMTSVIWSTNVPMRISIKPGMFDHSQLRATPWKLPSPIASATSFPIAMTRANVTSMTPMASQSPLRGSHGEMSRRTANAAAGSTGSTHASPMSNPKISVPPTNAAPPERRQAIPDRVLDYLLRTIRRSSRPSPLQCVHFVHIRRPAVPEDPQNHRERQPHLRRRDRDHEHREDDASEQRRRCVHGERHHVDADGIQHQLHGHQDQHGVPPRQHAVHPDREEDGAEHDEVLQRHLLGDRFHPTPPPLPASRSRSRPRARRAGRRTRSRTAPPTG